MFIYPDNLKAKATLWLWELRDVAIIGVGFLFSVLAIAQTGILLPLVVTVLYAFLSIRLEGSSILDFLRYAVCFLILKQQYYEWGETIDNRRRNCGRGKPLGSSWGSASSPTTAPKPPAGSWSFL